MSAYRMFGNEKPARELAPWPDRHLAGRMLDGLDLGRSTKMNRAVKIGGHAAGVYTVCGLFWLVAAYPFSVVALIAQLTPAFGGASTWICVCAWSAFVAGMLMC